MNTAQTTASTRASKVVIFLAVWVGLALLLTCGLRPSRTSSDMSLNAVPPPDPSLIFPHFLSGHPLTLAPRALNHSLVMIPQDPSSALTFHGPDRFLVTGPDGTERVVSLSEFQRHLRSSATSLDLIDFRYKPDVDLDDLK